jgi:hypothetical protein
MLDKYTLTNIFFSVISSRGNVPIMVLYEYDGNAIMTEPIRNDKAGESLRSFQVTEQKIIARGLKPKLMTLDNEASKLLKDYLSDQNISFQLVPHYCRLCNAAARAIRSFKDHLKAGLCSTDKAFPMHLWDRLKPQAILMLNMIRASRINPKISADTHSDGQYDYNREPMAPPGTRIVTHETPSHRRSWAPHGQDGWYIGPALEYYRCYRVYICKTRSEWLVETVELFYTGVKVPFPSSEDFSTEAAKKLTYALLHTQLAVPFFQVGNEQLLALKKLAAIFEGAVPKHRQRTATPLIIMENNDSPPRVNIPVSPQTVQHTLSPPRVVVTTPPSQTDPNSHH